MFNPLTKMLADIDIYELVSFDIFDTLITRMTATPLGIFSIMQKKLANSEKFRDLPMVLLENFYTIRREAETFVRENYKRRFAAQDIKLDDIYKLIQNNYNLTDNQLDRLMDFEIETEILNIVPIEQNIEYLKELINRKKKVILISDMYHSEATIRRILSNIDTVFNNITIYVSAEFNKTKWSKDLYKFIKSQENVDYKNWVHIGDNLFSDIRMAKELGIRTKIIEAPKFQKYEEALLNNGFLSHENFNIQTTIGLARLSRIVPNKDSKAYRFGSSFAGPILFNFVNWLISDALSRKLDTLYFIARDGYVLKIIADEIIKENNYSIKTKYIYGSRMAWRVPGKENIKDILNWTLTEYPTKLTIDFFAARLGLSVDELEEFYKRKFTKRSKKLYKYLNFEEDIINNTDLHKFVISKNTAKYSLLKDYLTQEIDLNENFAFVDFNGSGRTQDGLSLILDKDISTYYFFTERNITNSKNSKKIIYFSSHAFQNHFLELLCRCPDGQCIGYQRDCDNIVPILEKFNSKSLLEWGFEDYIKGMLHYTVNAINFEKKNNIALHSFDVYRFYFRYLLNDLDKETAQILGDIPYIEVGIEHKTQKCAEELNITDFIKILLQGNKHLERDLSFISLKRSHKIYEKLYKFNTKYGSILRYFFDIKLSNKARYFYIRIFGITISFKNKNYKG